jgi:hypothetical protein
VSAPQSQQNWNELFDISVAICIRRQEGQLTLGSLSNDGSWPHILKISKSTDLASCLTTILAFFAKTVGIRAYMTLTSVNQVGDVCAIVNVFSWA